MADAKAIYEQFLLTPLKIKQQQQQEEAGDDADSVAGALAFDLASETDEEEREGGMRSDQAPVHTSPELERLRGRIESADLSDQGQPVTVPTVPNTQASRRRGSVRQPTGSDATVNAAPAIDTRRRAQNKKRVARSVAVPNARTGSEWVDTPSKASRPSKRSRRQTSTSSETDKENRDDAAESAAAGAALALVSRRITDNFEDADEEEVSEHVEQDESAATSSSSTSVSSPPQPASVSSSKSDKATKHVGSVASQPVRRSRRLAHQSSEQEDPVPAPPPLPVVDLLTPLCDALIATNTISGLLFALSLNTLRSSSHSVELAAPSSSLEAANAEDSTHVAATNPFQGVYNICWGIAQCEQLTQQQFKLPTVQLSPKRRHDASACALEKVLATTHSSAKSPIKKKKKMMKKKSVRFRSFDFSCLNLQYVENEHVAAMVDRMILSYGKLMDDVSLTLQQSERKASSTSSPTTLNMMRRLADVMTSESRWLRPSTRRDATHDSNEPPMSDQDTAEAARIVDAAYSSRDSMTQHEIRLAGEYFARQFDRLVSSSSSSSSRPVAFLHEMFSALISSAVRYKLRLVFLHSVNKDEDLTQANDESKTDGCLTATHPTPEALAAATYAHQDVGAAIHRALQESLLYLPLVSPMLALLSDQRSDDKVDAVADQLKQCSLDDVERVDQFILARRFLRYHVARALDPQASSAEFTSGIWKGIERVCSIAQRFYFEDEAHLFPLASVHAFNDTLASEDTRLERLDRAVQAFWEAQEGYEASRANGLQECAECRSVITRAEAPVSIACTLCASCFHLKCLHLPDSFAQFAAHYTCPACFLGRNRMEY